MKAWMGGCCVLLTLGCGGAAHGDRDAPAPPHEGAGAYELTIERVSDDCEPPLVEGAMGSKLVVVASGAHAGANIPLYGAGIVEGARQDVDFQQTGSSERPSELAGCDARYDFELKVAAADSERIDVAFTQTLVGFSACPGAAEQDCTSERLFHFRWLYACEDAPGMGFCGER